MAKPIRNLPKPPEVPPTSLSERSAISPRISPAVRGRVGVRTSLRCTRRSLMPLFAREDTAGFVYDEELVGGHIGELLAGAAGPLHFQRHGGSLTEPEGERQVAGRSVAGTAAHHIPLLPRPALYAHHGADTVAIRFRPGQAHVQPVVAVAAIVAIQVRGTVIGGNQNIEVAIAVEVRIGGAARHNRT